MSNLEKQLINYYSNDNKNKIEFEIKKFYNYKYDEINLFTGKKYKITNINSNINKSCIFDSLCNYNDDGILITDEGDIFSYNNYGYQNENPIKIKLYNSTKITYKLENKLFYHDTYLKLSDLYYKGSEFKGIWIIE